MDGYQDLQSNTIFQSSDSRTNTIAKPSSSFRVTIGQVRSESIQNEENELIAEAEQHYEEDESILFADCFREIQAQKVIEDMFLD